MVPAVVHLRLLAVDGHVQLDGSAVQLQVHLIKYIAQIRTCLSKAGFYSLKGLSTLLNSMWFQLISKFDFHV